MFRRFRRLSLLAALCLILLPAAARAAHDQLTIGISQFPPDFNPLIDPVVSKSYVEGMTTRPFTVYDKDQKLVCLLCTRLPTLENGGAVRETQPDGKPGIAMTFTIDPNAKWGDGTPVTTDDVMFTWQVGKAPDSGVGTAELFQRIRAIDVKDAKTFTLHMDRVDFDYNAINDFQVLPAHLEKAAFADPAQYHSRSLYETDTTNPGLYNGPYVISQVQRGQFVVLDQNPYWSGKKPYFKRIVVKSIEVTPYLEAALLSGDVDMIPGEVGFSLDSAFAFMTRNRPEWTVTFKPSLSYEHITVNMENPVLSDLRVRQALLYGLNRAQMVSELFKGKQPVADSLVNPSEWFFDSHVQKYPFDAAKAGALLDQAGWKMGPDKLRHNAKGDPLTLELMTTAGNRSRETMELFIQAAWTRLGAKVTLRNQPSRTFFGETVLKHDFPDLALFAWLSSPEEVPFSELYSSQVPTKDNGYSGENAGAYRNPEMDKVIDAIEIETDKTKRQALWNQLQEIYAHDLPELPLTFRTDPYILPTWLTGVEPTGNQYPSTLWVEDWKAKS